MTAFNNPFAVEIGFNSLGSHKLDALEHNILYCISWKKYADVLFKFYRNVFLDTW